MGFNMKPLSCDPARIKGMSERLIISHYENNYGGAVKRLNLIEEKLAELDYANAPGFMINGLKREQLIAMNSMILHELFFDGLGEQSEPGPAYGRRLCGTLVPMSAGVPNSLPWGKRSGAAPAGFCCPGRRGIGSSSINGRQITATRLQVAHQFSRWICTNIPITSTSAQRQQLMSTPSWLRSAGKILIVCSSKFPRDTGRNRATSPHRRFVMRAVFHFCSVATFISGSADRLTAIDWQKVDAAFGRKPAISDDVHRYGFPRTDLSVTLDGVTIKPRSRSAVGWPSSRRMAARW